MTQLNEVEFDLLEIAGFYKIGLFSRVGSEVEELLQTLFTYA